MFVRDVGAILPLGLSEGDAERHIGAPGPVVPHHRVMAPGDELQAKVMRILDDHERWAAKDMTVWMGWVYPDLHAILIGVETEDLDAARTALEEAYGPAIEVEFHGPIVAL
jgi:hypothetical protein